MTVSPHPQAITNVAEQRRMEILAQVDRERLTQRAMGVGITPHVRRDVPVLQLAAALLTVRFTIIWQH